MVYLRGRVLGQEQAPQLPQPRDTELAFQSLARLAGVGQVRKVGDRSSALRLEKPAKMKSRLI